MSRRFYLRSNATPRASTPRNKASYPIWFLPLMAGVGAGLAVLLFWLIGGDKPDMSQTEPLRGPLGIETMAKDTGVVASPTPMATPNSAAPPRAPAVSLIGVRIQVLNGCGVKGLARRISPALRAWGLDVRETKNAPHPDFERSSVIDRRGDMDVARALADSLGIDKSRVTSEFNPNLSDIDVSLIVGKDYKRLKLNYQNVTGE